MSEANNTIYRKPKTMLLFDIGFVYLFMKNEEEDSEIIWLRFLGKFVVYSVLLWISIKIWFVFK